jgi:thiamine pyrophosphokinase
MLEKNCYIVGAGENYGLDFAPVPGDFVIAVDGGFSYLRPAAFRPIW